MKIHHIGYLVEDVSSASLQMEKLGFVRLGDISIDEERQIYIVFMDNGGYMIELIQPISESSPIYLLRKRHKNSPYHICYETDDIDLAITKLCENEGIFLFAAPLRACAIAPRARVAFIMSDSVGMIELVQLGEQTIC